jgi:hypothetical protein
MPCHIAASRFFRGNYTTLYLRGGTMMVKNHNLVLIVVFIISFNACNNEKTAIETTVAETTIKEKPESEKIKNAKNFLLFHPRWKH